MLEAINPGSLPQCLAVPLWGPGMGMGILEILGTGMETPGWDRDSRNRDENSRNGNGDTRSEMGTPGLELGLASHPQLHPPGFISRSLSHVRGVPRRVCPRWAPGGAVGWGEGSGQTSLSPKVLECPSWSLRPRVCCSLGWALLAVLRGDKGHVVVQGTDKVRKCCVRHR